MPTVLTIAGSDSSGRAGLQADVRTLTALDVHAATAVTAITVQNSRGVSAIVPLEADLVTEQIEAAAADGGIAATKIGMLGNAAIAEAVAAAIEELDLPLVVLDPVLAASSGARLLDADGVQVLLTELIPRVFVLTPNVLEAEALSGRRIASLDDAREAARRLHQMGAAHVIVKGGHLAISAADGEVVDLLFDGKAFHESRVPRVTVPRAGGTGCSYASAVAAHLAHGRSLTDAAALAQNYVAASLRPR